MPLTGTFQRSLDDKQRLAIPKTLRDELAAGDDRSLFLAPETDRSLSLFSPDVFSRRAQRLEQDPALQGRVKNYLRLYYSQAEQVDLDAQGRIRIPERLLQFAGLQQDVMLLGVNDHVEIWDQEQWRTFLSRHEEDFDRLVGEAFA
ncbi:MAG: division/cell wall cluster transcriptional repressor MraZ [Planctomyces sp.]|nr:division/cell wall cluster transcriptional repressor MraZ [Planctomyces sp.]